MSTRDDIKNGRLIYSCNCGWIDLGHADAKSRRPNVGAASLWSQLRSPKESARYVINANRQAVLAERYAEATGTSGLLPEFEGFPVTYKQDMGVKVGVWIRASEGRRYAVRSGLSEAELRSVALSIFMEVSRAFEDMQGRWPFSWTRAKSSSFSEEDLVSNLIGFYGVVLPGVDYVKLCGPVSIQASETIWDRDGAVGDSKNSTFRPVFHACADCPGGAAFPAQLQAITAARKGEKFFDLVDQPLMPARWR